MFTLSLEASSSQSNQPPSPPPVFSGLCELSASALCFSFSRRSIPANRFTGKPLGASNRFSLQPFNFKSSTFNSFSVSPFPATLTTSVQSTENTSTLSLAFATLTSLVMPKSFACHSYKKIRGVGGTPVFCATQTLPLFSTASKHPTRSNTRNSILVIRLLHCSLYTRGGGGTDFSLCAFWFSLLTAHYPLSTFLYSLFPTGNKLGSAGGESAMASNSGYCARSGSGTFTLERFKMLMSCRALTTPLPW
jgi:hypothetical protein